MKTTVKTSNKPNNTCAKMRKIDQPYEIWKAGEWEWRVLKKWQTNDDKPYARWFCGVRSPYTCGRFELGDVYVSEIMSVAVRVYEEEVN